jgi:hypothetical protein
MAAKGVIRVRPLINAISCANCLSEVTTGAVYAIDYSVGSSARYCYAGMHLLSTVNGVAWTMTVQSATACAFAAPTTRFTFAAQSCRGAQIAAPLAFPTASTEAVYWRAIASPASTTDYRLGVIWLGIQ